MKGIVVREVIERYAETVVSLYYYPVSSKVSRSEDKIYIEYDNKSFTHYRKYIESISTVTLVEKEKLALFLTEKIQSLYSDARFVRHIDYDLLFTDSKGNTRCVSYEYPWNIKITNYSNNKSNSYDLGADFRKWLKLHEV